MSQPAADPVADGPAMAEAAGRLVVEAGDIALRWFRSSVTARDKGGRSGYDPVTEADLEIERYLRERLASSFPGIGVIGEEGGASGPAAGDHWIIDPIDGTKAFVSGLPLWGVLLGLVLGGRPVAGWCRQPYLDETYTAFAGAAHCEQRGEVRRLATSGTTDLAEATMFSTHPTMFAEPWERAAFEALAGRVRMQRFGGDCYAYCMLAAGHIDLVVEASLQPYDIVPLVPIVEGAGGRVTDENGSTPMEGGFVVAAATERLHAQALEVVAGFRAGTC